MLPPIHARSRCSSGRLIYTAGLVRFALIHTKAHRPPKHVFDMWPMLDASVRYAGACMRKSSRNVKTWRKHFLLFFRIHIIDLPLSTRLRINVIVLDYLQLLFGPALVRQALTKLNPFPSHDESIMGKPNKNKSMAMPKKQARTTNPNISE